MRWTYFHKKITAATQQKSWIICLLAACVVKYDLTCIHHRNLWVKKKRKKKKAVLILAWWQQVSK